MAKAKDYSRTLRVGDQIQRELSSLIMREVKDPRLGMVTITEVEVSRDLAVAKIFVTLLNNTQEVISEQIGILNTASGYLRSLLGKNMRLRIIPQLKFIFDDSIERAANMSALINKARNLDGKF